MMLCGSLTAIAADPSDREDPRWRQARLKMVEDEVIGNGITDERVVAAMRATPRHLFVPAWQRQHAYLDAALPIGHGQTISPPLVVASMTRALKPVPSDRVLEIGTGSGYQAAVLSELVREVCSIEIVEPLGRSAARTLRRLGYRNVFTKIGDGFAGWPERAPFDKIIVTCSPENVPQPLVEQLREGGRIVVPLGERYQQLMHALVKENGVLRAEAVEPTFFVPMTGQAEAIRDLSGESGLPGMVNGSFEESDDRFVLPGWYYVRQAEVVEEASAPDRKHVLKFVNKTHGRGSQALQAIAADGRQVDQIEISLWVKTSDVHPANPRAPAPRLELTFYNERRAPILTHTLGPWIGTSDWRRYELRGKVPAQSRLAVMSLGLFGSVGELWADNVEVTGIPR